MRTEGVFLDSVGVFLPEWASAEQAVADGLYDEEVWKVSGMTGTHVAGETPALDMAVSAARTALERSSLDPEAIECLVHSGIYYQGPEGSYPPGYILRELDLEDAASLYLRQGCNGMLTALETAVGRMTGAAGAEAVLLTTAQNFSSPSVNRWNDFGQTYVLSDGGAAVLVGESGFAELRSINSGTLPKLERWHRGQEPLVPSGDAGAMGFNVNERFDWFNENEMSLADTLESLTEFGAGIMRRSLVDAGLNAADLARVIPINLDGRMVEFSVMAPLGLPMSRSSWDFGRTVGHAGAADPVISLEHLLCTGELSPGDHVLLTSQGPGWICSACVLTIREVPDWAR
ncbi:ketoacyl-ACP synthase III family protein [Streptomyces sp. NPDC052051]|uniref:ketoacyl-ACP synthase III family protein n=1 Tax=Streptomyces sp. NPDC052051 TaxID=3154649 RepID=UPI00343F2C7A